MENALYKYLFYYYYFIINVITKSPVKDGAY